MAQKGRCRSVAGDPAPSAALTRERHLGAGVSELTPPVSRRRAGPLNVDNLVEHARRQQHAYSYRCRPMASVSVAATIAGWPLDRILEERLSHVAR